MTIYITRKHIEDEDYEADPGILILLAPEGEPTTSYFRKMCAKQSIIDLYPRQQKRKPGDKKENSYEVGDLFHNTKTDE